MCNSNNLIEIHDFKITLGSHNQVEWTQVLLFPFIFLFSVRQNSYGPLHCSWNFSDSFSSLLCGCVNIYLQVNIDKKQL